MVKLGIIKTSRRNAWCIR